MIVWLNSGHRCRLSKSLIKLRYSYEDECIIYCLVMQIYLEGKFASLHHVLDVDLAVIIHRMLSGRVPLPR